MSTSSSEGQAFSISAPTPLAESWKLAAELQGTPLERLSRRWAFLENCLRFLVAAFDAERRRLGLPPPSSYSKLRKRLDTPTTGMWMDGAMGLAEALKGRSDCSLTMLRDRVLSAEMGCAAEEILKMRNKSAHDSDGAISAERAAALLEYSRPHLHSLMDGLSVLAHTPVVVLPEPTNLRAGGRGEALQVFRGSQHQSKDLSAQPPLVFARPMLLASGGVALNLAPWVWYSTFERSALPHLRLLDRWLDSPRYLRPGHGSDALILPELKGVTPDEAIDRLSAISHLQDPTLEQLRQRICGVQDDGKAPQVPGYTLDRVLGRGASGAVWLARDQSNGAQVALKVLHPALREDPQHQARLQREHQALLKLSHPGVARVMGLVQSPEVGPVLLMEYVSGRSLQDRVAQRPMDVGAAARLCAQLLDALSSVHAAGLVHRDIKPANILMDTHDRPRLVDFGIVRAGNLTQLTQTLDRVGTPAYAAPEQRTGDPVDARTDIYAVGRLLPAICAPEGEWKQQLAQLPGALQCIVRRATQESPAARYPSAQSMRVDLEARLVTGWDGPPVGIGELLPGGIQLEKQLESPAAGIWLFSGRLLAGGAALGVLIAGAAPEDRQRLKDRLKACPTETLHRAGCNGLRTSDDGLLYAEIRGDEPEAWAARVLGPATPPRPPATPTMDTASTVAVVAGALATGAAALGALFVSSKLKDQLNPAKASAPPSREHLLSRAQGLGLLLCGLAHASRETQLDAATWTRLCESPLRPIMTALGPTGSTWAGPVGLALADLKEPKALAVNIAALGGERSDPAALASAEQALKELTTAAAQAAKQLPNAASSNYVRKSGAVWEVALIQGGKVGWVKVLGQ